MKRYLTIQSTSEKLDGRSRSSILRDINAGRLPRPIKIGGRLYLCEEAIDAKLAEQSEQESGE
jgi:predicted DNA-binding transcriptional regulator AlpA